MKDEESGEGQLQFYAIDVQLTFSYYEDVSADQQVNDAFHFKVAEVRLSLLTHDVISSALLAQSTTNLK